MTTMANPRDLGRASSIPLKAPCHQRIVPAVTLRETHRVARVLQLVDEVLGRDSTPYSENSCTTYLPSWRPARYNWKWLRAGRGGFRLGLIIKLMSFA